MNLRGWLRCINMFFGGKMKGDIFFIIICWILICENGEYELVVLF